MSMKPGERTRPLASMICSSLSGLKFPTVTMRSPAMRTLRMRRGAPVPSATWALMMTVEGDLSCEVAKTQANASTKNKRIAKCQVTRDAGVRRRKTISELFMPHVYNKEEGAGKGKTVEEFIRWSQRELSPRVLLRRVCLPK